MKKHDIQPQQRSASVLFSSLLAYKDVVEKNAVTSDGTSHSGIGRSIGIGEGDGFCRGGYRHKQTDAI